MLSRSKPRIQLSGFRLRKLINIDKQVQVHTYMHINTMYIYTYTYVRTYIHTHTVSKQASKQASKSAPLVPLNGSLSNSYPAPGLEDPPLTGPNGSITKTVKRKLILRTRTSAVHFCNP